MGIIEDLKLAIMNYPTERVDVSITSFAMVSRGNLNVNDVFKFKMKIVNQGCLEMTKVKLAANGTAWAQVGTTTGGPFGALAASGAFSVEAFGSHETGWFYGKGTTETSNQEKTIVTAQLLEWDASLNFILNSRSMAGPKEGHLEKIVYPI